VSLFKRGGVWWSYVWRDGVRDARSTGTGNRKIAEQIAQKHKEELALKAAHLTELNPQMKFAELSGRFLAEADAKAWHRDRLKLLLPYFGDMAISRIGKGQVRQYRQARHEAKTLTETTLNRDVECLRHLLYWAVDEGFLAINPIARIRLARIRRKKKPVLSPEEERLLFAQASAHLQQIIIAALDTGMRRGEILNQLWDDVDFSRRLLYVSHSKTPEGEAREIPLSERLFALLSGMRKESGMIFTYEGKAIHKIKTAWKAAIRRSGIRYIRFHYLRHTFNTRLLELGVTREVRMALLGHTFGDTHESYEHVELPLKRDAIRRLDVWLKEQITNKEGVTNGSAGVRSDHPGDSGESDSGIREIGTNV
jgi:integrase